MRFTFFVALALSLVLIVGCKKDDNPYGTVHVEGTVTVDGAPVEGINVVFAPRGGDYAAGGVTNASGKFTVNTGGYSGAKPGSYDVTFTKIEVPGGDLSLEEFQARFGNRQPTPEYLIPQKYEDAKTSGIEPITVSEDRRQNVFTFELTSD